MNTLVVVVPGDLDTRTGGYGYDRRIIAGLRDRGWSVDVLRLDATFPHPTPRAREEAAQALRGIADGRLVMVDGLALGVLPIEAAQAAARLRLVALVHHPLAEETGLDHSTAAALEESERRALAVVRHVIVTSRNTAAALARYAVVPERISIVEPGTDRAPLARAYRDDSGSADALPSRRDEPLTLLCVASITPRKDHETLFSALATLTHRKWSLRCAGAMDGDSATVRRLHAMLAQPALSNRVTLLGDLDEAAVAVEYDRADVFVLPTRHEGYGMAIAEALARGLPVISTPTGAIADLVADQAGILVPPGDVRTLADALVSVIDDERLRHRLAAGARRVRATLPTWDDAADRIIETLARLEHTRPQRT